jgi:hypothetical protein
MAGSTRKLFNNLIYYNSTDPGNDCPLKRAPGATSVNDEYDKFMAELSGDGSVKDNAGSVIGLLAGVAGSTSSPASSSASLASNPQPSPPPMATHGMQMPMAPSFPSPFVAYTPQINPYAPLPMQPPPAPHYYHSGSTLPVPQQFAPAPSPTPQQFLPPSLAQQQYAAMPPYPIQAQALFHHPAYYGAQPIFSQPHGSFHQQQQQHSYPSTSAVRLL